MVRFNTSWQCMHLTKNRQCPWWHNHQGINLLNTFSYYVCRIQFINLCTIMFSTKKREVNSFLIRLQYIPSTLQLLRTVPTPEIYPQEIKLPFSSWNKEERCQRPLSGEKGVVKMLSRLMHCRMSTQNNIKTPEAHTLFSSSGLLRNSALV